MALRIGNSRTIPLVLLGVGISLRVAALVRVPVASDGAEYAVLADSLLDGRGMWLPWGEQWQADTWVSGPSHHYPPLYPLYLVPFLAAMDFSPAAAQVGALVAGLALLAVFYMASASLFDPTRALWFSALVSLDPVLVATTGTGYSENLVTLLFVVTVAAILKSLERPRWILVAGVTAALAYLTKSSVGPFFLIAGLAGFAWRFHFVRWGVFRDRAYLGAIGLFLFPVGVWAGRNLFWFWDGSLEGLTTAWQTSDWFSQATGAAIVQPIDLLGILALRLPFFAMLFLLVAAPWWRELRVLSFRKDQSASALGLAAGLTYVLAWIISGILWVVERSPVFWADMSRYVVIANPIVWWMAAKQADPGSPSFRRRFGVAATILVVLNAAAFLTPPRGVFEAYHDLRDRAEDGDLLALDEVPKYEAAIHLAGTGIRLEPFYEDTDADYVLTTNLTRVYSGYALEEMYGDTNDTAVLPSYGAAIWTRAS